MQPGSFAVCEQLVKTTTGKYRRTQSSFIRDCVMAKVQVLNVAVLDNPSPFGNPFQFEITFECMEDLPEGEFCIRSTFNIS